jgi:hypothetical protein
MDNARLARVAQMPVEQMISLPIEELLEMAREADEAMLEAKSLKNWINGIMDLKRSMNNQEDIILGGVNEQDADY